MIHVSGDSAFNTPTDWALVDSDTNTGIHTYVFWKIAVSGDVGASTLNVTSSGSGASAGYMYRLSGTESSTPIGAANSGNGSSSTPTVTTITPAAADSMIMFFVGANSAGGARTNASYTIATSPPTFNEQYDSQWDTNNYHISAAAGLRSAATATGSGTSTLDGSDPWAAVMCAVSPATIPFTATPAAVAITAAVAVATFTIPFTATPTAVSTSATLPAVVLTIEAPDWTNASKNAATFSNATKHAATASNTAKNSSTWTNQSKS